MDDTITRRPVSAGRIETRVQPVGNIRLDWAMAVPMSTPLFSNRAIDGRHWVVNSSVARRHRAGRGHRLVAQLFIGATATASRATVMTDFLTGVETLCIGI